MRNAELAEIQRLEDAERRRTEEKERRLQEQLRILKEKQEVAEKIAARAFAQSYLASLVPSVFENLTSNGYFYDVVEKELESGVLPWLTVEVNKNLDKLATARKLVDGKLIFNSRSNSQCHSFCKTGREPIRTGPINLVFLNLNFRILLVFKFIV